MNARVWAALLLGISCSLSGIVRGEALPVAKYPAEEKKLVNTVDPWGLAFSDQMERFQSYFQQTPGAEFAVGYTHNLVKNWQNKYWFRGETFTKSGTIKGEPVWGTTSSTVSFQIAVLPKTGAATAKYSVAATSPLPVTISRQEFIKLGSAPYPRFQSDYWPDPLVAEQTGEVSGTNLAVFLCEIEIPRHYRSSSLTCDVTVTRNGADAIKVSVPVEIVALDIQPNALPLTALFSQGTLSDSQFEKMSTMVLAHHLQPLASAELQKAWKAGVDKFDAQVEFYRRRGQNTFLLWNPPEEKVYSHLKEKGWLSQFIIQSNTDEPPEDAFNKNCIPYAAAHRKKFPGLRMWLASECHPRIAEGCDIVWTDLSSSKYDPRTYQAPAGFEVWHYYCHMPIGCQLRAPLTRAPNMEIDNAALEHRLAMWMSAHYKSTGIFIWSGNSEWSGLGADFWKKLDLSGDAYRNAAVYPYGGTHHGNGVLVYPPRDAAGEAVPSLRLKVLRDGMEDVAIMAAARKKFGASADTWLSPVPAVFQHPQYFDALPETLLKKRTEILKKVRELSK